MLGCLKSVMVNEGFLGACEGASEARRGAVDFHDLFGERGVVGEM